MITSLRTHAAHVRARRAERRDRAHLRASLATYRTPAERAEIESILLRHPDEVSTPVRELLDVHRA